MSAKQLEMTFQEPAKGAEVVIAPCRYHFWLDIVGKKELDVAVYGHYITSVVTTPAMERLYEDLPDWAVGAEWAKFASSLVGIRV